MEVIRQTENNTCLACVMAMMVGESEGYVLDWFEHIDPPFSDEDAFLFLAHHGIYLAFLVDLGKDGEKISDSQEFKVSFDMVRPAYVIVKSKTHTGRAHAVFWDGKNILDPQKDEPQEILKYDVISIYPMLWASQRKEAQES